MGRMTSEKWGYINCRVGHRRPRRLIRRIRRIMDRNDFDVLVLVEAAPYAAALRAVVGRHSSHRLVQLAGSAEARNCAMIVRDGRKVRAVSRRRMSPGWIRAKRNRHKGFHEGRTSLLVNYDGVRVHAGHGPPRPHREGVFRSRLVAKRKFYRNTRALLETWNRRDRQWIMVADFNVPVHGRFLQRFARSLGGRARGRGIDGVIEGPGVKVRRMRKHRLRGWFDHPMLSFIVRY